MKILFFALTVFTAIHTLVEKPSVKKPRILTDLPKHPPTRGGLENKPAINANGEQTLCNQELMMSYGLEGHSTAQASKHDLCPSITRNCCTKNDEKASVALWNNENKFIVERYYETYLYSVKYILGYSEETFKMAKKLANSENEECRKTATDYLEMNFNPKIVRDIYKSYVTGLEKLGDLRRGFYCILCDAFTQDRLHDYWSVTNLFYSDRVYFSNEFCQKLVDYTIRSSYFTVYYLKRFSENLVKLTNCKTGTDNVIEYEIPFWTKKQVKNCYYFKNDYFFFFCERYCEQFHLTKPSGIFDGDLGELKKFVDFVMENRHKAFDDPDNNILMYLVGFEEDYLRYNFEDVLNDKIFFRPTTNTVKLENFETDVLYFGGMDPWQSVQESLYQLVISGVGIMKLFGSVILAFTLFV